MVDIVEEIDLAQLQAYMEKQTVLPAVYKKKDLLIYAVGIGCTEDKFTYEMCGGLVVTKRKQHEISPVCS